MPWHKLPASQRRALLQKSLATRRSRILDLAAEVGPVIEKYRAQGYGYRRIAALLSVDRDDPRRFIFYEVYVEEADFDAHCETPWLKRQMERTAHMIDGEVEMVGFGHRIAAPNK